MTFLDVHLFVISLCSTIEAILFLNQSVSFAIIDFREFVPFNLEGTQAYVGCSS